MCIGNLVRDPRDLERYAGELKQLSPMHDRVAQTDIERAPQALLDSAHDIAYLFSGGPYRLIENDNHGASYLVYTDTRSHHHHLNLHKERSNDRTTKKAWHRLR